MHLPTTFWLIAGSSEYATENISGVEGATADCMALGQDLLDFGYPDDQVLAFCGDKMLTASIFQAVDGLHGRLEAGDSLIVFWIGHGGAYFDDPELALWQPYDGIFVAESTDSHDYGQTGIDPLTVVDRLRRSLPTSEVLFLTDTARGGTFGNWLSLNGPRAESFQDLPHTRAVSPSLGSGQAGELRRVLGGCLRRDLAMAEDGKITVMEAGTCLGLTSNATIIGVGDWTDANTTLIWYPPAPTVVSVPPAATVTKHPIELRPIVRWTGFGVGLVGAIAGGVTFVEANAIYAEAEGQNFEVAPSWQPNEQRYAALRTATYVLFGVGVAGGLTFGSSFLELTPTPHGVAISGSF